MVSSLQSWHLTAASETKDSSRAASTMSVTGSFSNDKIFVFAPLDVSSFLSYDKKETKEWYDGYHFGNVDIYCPWDVINYVSDQLTDPGACPKSYWINSSGNDLVKRFVDKADTTTKDEIEQLIAGDAVEKKIRLDL